MGLGKTIQVISLFALLREKGVNGPFIVVAPLATLPNWVLEIRKWLPSASVCLYHGTAAERGKHKIHLLLFNLFHLPTPTLKFTHTHTHTHTHTQPELLREEQMPLGRSHETSTLFPIVVTSYEITSIDRKFLMQYHWRWLIVDEGQRIKNRNGRLFNELKEIPSESRLLLSGTVHEGRRKKKYIHIQIK
jgi:ATP-dependent DNA helicase